MAFVLQNSDGTAPAANAYLSVAAFKAYHQDRGNDLPTGVSDTSIEHAIVSASDFLDGRFNYIGYKRSQEQTTEWPRYSVYDKAGFWVSDVPVEVEEATAEYAFLALSRELLPVPSADLTGTVAPVRKIRERVGPIETETEYYQPGAGSSPGRSPLPVYSSGDLKLKRAGFVVGDGGLVSIRLTRG